MSTLLLLNACVDREALLTLNGGPAAGDLECLLYVNNHTPALPDDNGDFTICSAGGYADVTLIGADWSGSTTAGVADYTYPAITFTFSDDGGGQTIYGVLIRDVVGDASMAGLLGTPFEIPENGGTLVVNLEYVHQQCA